jgi:hypothetical protein
MRLTAAQRANQRRIAKAVAELDFALPGSVVIRNTRCGKASCACHAEPPKLHGPYIEWTRKVAAKTVTKILTQDQLDDYQPWLENARRLRSLVTELQALTLEIVEADPRFKRK